MSKKQVLFFVGEDITAHLIMNRVLNDIVAKDEYEPVIYLVKNAPSAAAAAIPQIREFSFFEKKLLNETVYPFIEKTPSPRQPNMSPRQIADEHGFHVEYVDNLNSPEFVAKIAAKENIACGISLRCTQLFRKDLVEAVKKSAPLLNLHSGLLPDYRGVMTTVRRMFDIATGKADGTDYGCTLHKIDPYDPAAVDKGIDTGKILMVKSLHLNPKHSAYQAHVGLVDGASEAVIGAIDEIGQYTMRGYPQNQDQSRYFTFPNEREIKEWKDAGIVLVRAADAMNTLVDAFSRAGTPHANMLRAAMQASIEKWYADNCKCGVNDGGAHALVNGCDDLVAEVKNGPLAGMRLPQHAADALNNPLTSFALPTRAVA